MFNILVIPSGKKHPQLDNLTLRLIYVSLCGCLVRMWSFLAFFTRRIANQYTNLGYVT